MMTANLMMTLMRALIAFIRTDLIFDNLNLKAGRNVGFSIDASGSANSLFQGRGPIDQPAGIADHLCLPRSV